MCALELLRALDVETREFMQQSGIQPPALDWSKWIVGVKLSETAQGKKTKD